MVCINQHIWVDDPQLKSMRLWWHNTWLDVIKGYSRRIYGECTVFFKWCIWLSGKPWNVRVYMPRINYGKLWQTDTNRMRIFVAILGRMRLCLPHKYENNVFVGIHGERERESASIYNKKVRYYKRNKAWGSQ